MTSPVFTPLQMFYSTSGLPLTDGYIYIGTASQNPQTNPIAVYWDAAGTIPAAQPIRTSGGYPIRNGSPATVFVLATDFSLIVRDKSSKLVFSRLSGNAFSAEWVTYTPAGTGAVPTTVQAKLRDIEVSFSDFAVVFDDSTDNSTILQAQLNKGPGVTFAASVGTARFSTALLWAKDQFRIEGKCPTKGGAGTIVGSCLKYTGTGTALTIGLAPDASNAALKNAQIEKIRLQVAANTAIGLRAWECNGARVKDLSIYGNSGTGRYGLKIEGSVNSVYDTIDISGENGAAGVPANYLQYGAYVTQGFGGDPVTTNTFKNAYIHYCLNGAYVSGATTWYDSIFESNTIGFLSSGDNTLINPWFEANLTTDLYIDTNSYTVINGGRINAYARQQFFDGAGVTKLVVRNVRFQSTNAAPRLFNGAAGSLAGSSITLDGNIFPANFTINGIGGNNIDWRNISVPSMTQRTLVFKQTGVAANTGYTMPQDNGTTAAIVMSQPGHILATRTYYTGATITAGTFDTAVVKNGVGVSDFTSALLTTTPGAINSIHFLNKFVAGDTLQAYVHTSAGFLATGGQFVTEIIVSLGNDGVA